MNKITIDLDRNIIHVYTDSSIKCVSLSDGDDVLVDRLDSYVRWLQEDLAMLLEGPKDVA